MRSDINWFEVGVAIVMLSIPLAIALSALGIPNPLTDLWAGLMGFDACSIGSMRPGHCGGP